VPVKRNKQLAIIQRRQQVAQLYLQGWTQVRIAEHLGVAQPTICEDLKRLAAEWKESSLRDLDLARDIELKRVDSIQAEASEAWQKSKKPAQSAVVTGEGRADQKVRKTMKNQHGDPRYLDIMLKCVASRRAVLGLDAPTQLAPVLPADHDHATVVVAQLSVTELRVLKRLKERSAPAASLEVIDADTSDPVHD